MLLPPLTAIDVTTLLGDGDVALDPGGNVSASVRMSPRVIGSGPLLVSGPVAARTGDVEKAPGPVAGSA